MKEIDCQGKDCETMAEEIDNDYYACYSCGWAGSKKEEVE